MLRLMVSDYDLLVVLLLGLDEKIPLGEELMVEKAVCLVVAAKQRKKGRKRERVGVLMACPQ